MQNVPAAKRRIVLIAHNLRSTHNVGALLRTADGLGIETVYLTGYTPYPAGPRDARLPHLARKIDAAIHKTALGAETSVIWEHIDSAEEALAAVRRQGFRIVGLEQDPRSQPLPAFQPPQSVALLVGREVEGIESDILALCDDIVEIPMAGRKESFNVAVAAAMALYRLSF